MKYLGFVLIVFCLAGCSSITGNVSMDGTWHGTVENALLSVDTLLEFEGEQVTRYTRLNPTQEYQKGDVFGFVVSGNKVNMERGGPEDRISFNGAVSGSQFSGSVTAQTPLGTMKGTFSFTKQ
jgi:hypothetical protein